MRGVVIWISPSEPAALVWCEDSRDIAVANGAGAWRNAGERRSVGDYVGFDCIEAEGHRLCRDLHTITPHAAPDLPGMILSPSRLHANVPGNRLLHLCASRD